MISCSQTQNPTHSTPFTPIQLRRIKKSIGSGRCSSAREVIRVGLQLDEEREKKINLLREAIEAGEKSGYVKNFDPI